MPPRPVTGPSVWYGRDLARREHEWIYRLSAAELTEIDAAYRKHARQNGSLNGSGRLSQAHEVLRGKEGS